MALSATQTGGCLCGAVRFTLAEPATGYSACHCAMCRKFSGGIELGIMVGPGGVTLDREEGLRTYRSSDWAERGFCGVCGSSLFWRMTAEGPGQGAMSVSAGALDSLDGLSLQTEVYIDAKPGGHAFAGDRKRLTEAEIVAAFAAGEPQ